MVLVLVPQTQSECVGTDKVNTKFLIFIQVSQPEYLHTQVQQQKLVLKRKPSTRNGAVDTLKAKSIVPPDFAQKNIIGN